jgi:hypothetical protein
MKMFLARFLDLGCFFFFFVLQRKEDDTLFLETVKKDHKKKVTWLILPVVICLSQRLSHACLSINEIIQ